MERGPLLPDGGVCVCVHANNKSPKKKEKGESEKAICGVRMFRDHQTRVHQGIICHAFFAMSWYFHRVEVINLFLLRAFQFSH